MFFVTSTLRTHTHIHTHRERKERERVSQINFDFEFDASIKDITHTTSRQRVVAKCQSANCVYAVYAVNIR